jgi:hypothetical protein
MRRASQGVAAIDTLVTCDYCCAIRAVARIASALALLAVLSGGAHAATWEVTRKTVIDPLNGDLHRHLPTFVRQHDLEAVLGLYVTDSGGGLTWDGAWEPYPGREERLVRWQGPAGAEPIRERWRRLLALLPTIDKAELRIRRVGWRDADDRGLPADVRLLVRGTCADGARCQLDQRMAIRVRPEGTRWRIAAEDVTARELVSRLDPRFTVATETAGIANVHDSGPSPAFQLFGGQDQSPVRASSGSAVADVDGDGCEDVFLAGGTAALYRSNCDGTFRDATAESGLPRAWPSAATGVVFFDADDDGDPDLYVAAAVGGDRFFRNGGDGRFADVTTASGIPQTPWTSMPTVADYDRDGFLDVYLVRMGDHERTVPDPPFAATNGVRSALLHNRGDGTFEDVTGRARVGFHGWGLAGAWGDYDGDGWPDLYVANEFGGNALYHNRGDGTFEDVTAQAGVADGGAGMSVAWADYDDDGDLDLFVNNMHANSGWALFHPDFPMPLPLYARVLGLVMPAEVRRRADEITDHLLRGSTLFRNDGGGRFTDVSDAAGVRDAQWGWSAEFLDYDNDGTLDLFSADGFVSGPLLDDV